MSIQDFVNNMNVFLADYEAMAKKRIADEAELSELREKHRSQQDRNASLTELVDLLRKTISDNAATAEAEAAQTSKQLEEVQAALRAEKASCAKLTDDYRAEMASRVEEFRAKISAAEAEARTATANAEREKERADRMAAHPDVIAAKRAAEVARVLRLEAEAKAAREAIEKA